MSVRCWKCGSKNVTVTVMNEQSYSIRKGVAGALLFGPGGAAMGVNGKSEEKVKYVCQACGEISSVCMAESMSKQIDEAIAEEYLVSLTSLKQSFPNIEWEFSRNEDAEEYSRGTSTKKYIKSNEIDDNTLEEIFAEAARPMTQTEVAKELARKMGINEDSIGAAAVSVKMKNFHSLIEVVSFKRWRTDYYTTNYICEYHINSAIQDIEERQSSISEREKELIFLEYDAVVEKCCHLSKAEKEALLNSFNNLKKLVQICEDYDSVIELMNNDTVSDYEKAIEKLNSLLIPANWKNSHELLLDCQHRVEKLKEAKLRQSRKENGLCPYCGGNFKGFFTRTCAQCGRKKDY